MEKAMKKVAMTQVAKQDAVKKATKKAMKKVKKVAMAQVARKKAMKTIAKRVSPIRFMTRLAWLGFKNRYWV